MYNSFHLIFHNNLHLLIDLSLIRDAHYSCELKMFLFSCYSSITGKDQSWDCRSCADKELERTSLPWECSRTEIASTEWLTNIYWVRVSKVKGTSCAIYSIGLSLPAHACLSLYWNAGWIAEKLWLLIISSCIPAFSGGKIWLSLMKGLHSQVLVR